MKDFEVRVNTAVIGTAWFTEDQMRLRVAEGVFEPGPQYERFGQLWEEWEAAEAKARRTADPLQRGRYLDVVSSTCAPMLVDAQGSMVATIRELRDDSTPERPNQHVIKVVFDHRLASRPT